MSELSQRLDEAERTGERTIIQRNGNDVAALVSMDELDLLEKLEDFIDLSEAERRLSDPAEEPLPYEAIRERLGLV
ncbi:MAG: type II toxin-antitoxin system Phd/YefM family antitoxin [Candidatus Hydrogenedentota bacterium]